MFFRKWTYHFMIFIMAAKLASVRSPLFFIIVCQVFERRFPLIRNMCVLGQFFVNVEWEPRRSGSHFTRYPDLGADLIFLVC